MNTQLNSGVRTTRKPHECWHCHETIPARENAIWQTNVDDGSAYTLYLHPECMTACASCPEYPYGECLGGCCVRGSTEER